MNAIFTYLTWTAKLRQAKKKKKVGITRHLDMIPGTLLPEHLPSFAWLVQPCKYCYEASKTCQRVTPPFHIRVHCPLGFIWALLGGFIFWAPETDLRKLLKLKRQNFTFLYIYIATKFVLNEVIFFFQFVFPSLPILCRLISFFILFTLCLSHFEVNFKENVTIYQNFLSQGHQSLVRNADHFIWFGATPLLLDRICISTFFFGRGRPRRCATDLAMSAKYSLNNLF